MAAVFAHHGQVVAFGKGLDGVAHVAQGGAGLDLFDAFPHGFKGELAQAFAGNGGLANQENMRLLSPNQPSLVMTVTSTFRMSPFFSTLSLGMPWQTT